MLFEICESSKVRELKRSRTSKLKHTKLKHVMIIADEPELTEALQADLHAEGYQVSVINDGLRGLLAAKRTATDLVVISWQPPRLTGVDICRRLRTGQYDQPILLLTQSDSSKERIAGLQAGASDCLSIPFDPQEFVARINASLLNQKPKDRQSVILRCADIQLNRQTREVWRGERLVRLTAREFDLLEYLMNHYFQVLTRAQILENVWGYEYVGSSNIIEVYIRYLRRKLEQHSDDFRVIHTVRSVGYIFREDS